jgi:hypothetical protein
VVADASGNIDDFGGERMMSWIRLLSPLVILVFLGLLGCITHRQNPAATQPVTVTDPATTQPSYWFEKPAPITIQAGDFDKLWRACEQATVEFGFKVDREDRRHGVLTSQPLTSAQFFEFWRRDVRTVDDAIHSSLATYRRTLRFEFRAIGGGHWDVTPKVLVERQAVAERRLTSVVLYRGAVGGVTPTRDVPRGTKESDQGILIPARYWYAVSRDKTLEEALGKSIEQSLVRHS